MTTRRSGNHECLGTKAEQQASRRAYTRATHQKITPQNCWEREFAMCVPWKGCNHVWRVMRPDAWVMIITTCVCVFVPAEEHSLHIIRQPFALLDARWVTSCFHRSRFPQQPEQNARPSHHAKRYNGWRPSKHTDCQKGSLEMLYTCVRTPLYMADAVCAYCVIPLC